MTLHRNLANSELHTPKGTDSAAANTLLYAMSGVASFTELFEACGTGYTTTGTWDYATDGVDGDGYITFDGLGNYAFLELEVHDITTTTDDVGFLEVGSASGWDSGSTFYTTYFWDAAANNVVGTSNVPNYVVDSDATGVNFSKVRLYNFNKSAPTVVEVWGGNPSGATPHNLTLSTRHTAGAHTKIRVVGLAGITSGTAYLKGIKG